MKKLFPFFLIAVLFMACGHTGTNQHDQKNSAKESTSIVEVDVPGFLNAKEELIGKRVRIKGEVAHVCKHGGKRLFLMHPDTEDRVKVTADDNIPAFKQELEGSLVVVTGLVEELRVDNAYLDEWQAEEEAEGHKEGEKKIHTGDGHEKEHGEEHEKEHGKEHEKGHEKEHEKGHEKEHKEGEDHEENHAMKQINALREKVKNSEKGYLSFFSIACETVEEVK